MAQDPEKSDFLSDVPVSSEHEERVAEVFDREHPRLLKSLLRKAPRQDAEDILSKAFTKVLDHPSASVSNLIAYLGQTIHHLLVNYYRDKKLRRNKLELFESEESGTVPSPEVEIIEQQHRDALNRVIDGMKPRVRLAMQLRLYEDLSTPEIVARFAERGIRVTERTVQRCLDRGYEMCRQALET
jgi:RNA polymerase sigma factor (sigma-70 family)